MVRLTKEAIVKKSQIIENRLKLLGYNIISMWEYDWTRRNKATLTTPILEKSTSDTQ